MQVSRDFGHKLSRFSITFFHISLSPAATAQIIIKLSVAYRTVIALTIVKIIKILAAMDARIINHSRMLTADTIRFIIPTDTAPFCRGELSSATLKYVAIVA